MKTALWIVMSLVLGAVIALQAAELSPFGVCEHPAGHSDEDVELEASNMEAAGIKWMRTDFSWSWIEPKQGEWHFERFDYLVKVFSEHGITILPILDYSSPWAGPAHLALEDWSNYVYHTVSHFKDRLHYWEVWNEPQGFWSPKPTKPEDYFNLLKASWFAIKRADPTATVLAGGYSGIPYDFIERLYKLGAAKYFEVMSVHPYRYPGGPEETHLMRDLAKLKELMSKYGDKDKPIWITEMGWPTHKLKGAIAEFVRKPLGEVLNWSAQQVLGKTTKVRAALFYEPAFPGCTQRTRDLLEELAQSAGWQTELVDEKALERLDRQAFDVVIMAQGEVFPLPAFPALERFVREGGLLIHFGGVPFYYTAIPEGDGWHVENASDEYRKRLHIQFFAWWTREGVPKEASRLKLVNQPGLNLPGGEFAQQSTRFFDKGNCKPGDEFLPLLEAYEADKQVGAPVALYKLNSDLKGGVLACTLRFFGSGISLEEQAQLLPRAYILTLASGVKVYFWYDFRNDGTDPTYNEHNFGIRQFDHSPKPAWYAYKAMTQALAGKPFVRLLQPDATNYVAVFGAPGDYTLAVWCTEPEGQVKLKLAGPHIQLKNWRGEPLSFQLEGGVATLETSQYVTYLQGVQSAALQP